MKDIPQLDFDRMKELAKADLFFLAKGVLGFDQVSESFHLPFCKFLQQPSKRKLTVLPRGFFKTTLATKSLAIFHSLRDPLIAQLIVCQKEGNANAILDDIREQWDRNDVLRGFFPELLPTSENRWSSQRALLMRPRGEMSQQECTYESAGIGTQLQSRHFDKIYADDLIVAKKDQVTGVWMKPSDEDISKAVGWHKMAYGLMRNVMDCEYLQTMTRWCPSDLYDYLSKNEPDQWDTYLKSAITPEGEAAFPGKYPLKALERIKQDQGSYMFSTQYLCYPLDPEMQMFNSLYNIYRDRRLKKLKFQHIIAAIDPAIGKDRQACPTALVVVGCTEEGKRYLLHVINDRLNPTEQVDAVFTAWERFHFKRLVVETTAYQDSLRFYIEERMKKEGRLFRIIEAKPGKAQRKEARIEGMQPSFKNGWWYVGAWMLEAQDQLDKYPLGSFRDILDALAYCHMNLPAPKGLNEEEEVEIQTTEEAFVTYEDIMKRLTHTKNRRKTPWDNQLREQVYDRHKAASVTEGVW